MNLGAYTNDITLNVAQQPSIAGAAANAVQQPPPLITSNTIINASTLQRRNFSLDGLSTGRSSSSMSQSENNMAFHVYYTATSPLYYELMPFVRALRFTNEVEAVKQLPPKWIKHVEDFNDPKFGMAQMPNSIKFIESQGIPMLCALTDSKTRANFMYKLYDTKLKKTENDRVMASYRTMLALTDQIVQLTANHEKHSSVLTKIKDAFNAITDNHSSIIDVITKLAADI